MKKQKRRAPVDPWKAFVYFVGKCAEGFGSELIQHGKTPTQTRNAVIGCFLDMAAGEACRVARSEGREPNPAKWRQATNAAFKRAREVNRRRNREMTIDYKIMLCSGGCGFPPHWCRCDGGHRDLAA